MPVPCPRCDSPLLLGELATAGRTVCTRCGSRNIGGVFPALFAPPSAPALPESALEGEAACFDHPSKRAEAACQQCGRFVCALCSVEFDGQVWCPTCVTAGRGQSKAVNLDPSRVVYDSIALTVPLVTLVIFSPLTVITGPGAVVFSIVTWKRPLSLVRRSRWRFVLAILLGTTVTVSWLWLVVYLWEKFRSGQ